MGELNQEEFNEMVESGYIQFGCDKGCNCILCKNKAKTEKNEAHRSPSATENDAGNSKVSKI